MREELKEITLKLKEWCDKYNKDYVTMCFINNSLMAGLSADDEDYEKCKVFIGFDEKEGN